MAQERDGKASVDAQIWDGDNFGPNGAVPKKYEEYMASNRSMSDRIGWMTALFSPLGTEVPKAKRGNLKAAKQAVWCILRLRPQVRFFFNIYKFQYQSLYNAAHGLAPEQNEPLATYQLTWSELPFLGGHEYRNAAKWYAMMAVEQCETNPPDNHTLPLALITLAKIALVEGDLVEALSLLNRALRLAPDVTVNNQKSRVLRGAALLWGDKRLHHLNTASKLLKEADDVPGIGADVRAKNQLARKQLQLA